MRESRDAVPSGLPRVTSASPTGSGAAAVREAVYLCRADALRDGGVAVLFEVRHGLQLQRAFAIRHDGVVHAYLNRCSHVPMEMDYQPGHFFDQTGNWLVCATHGAMYAPQTGDCMGGPCRGGLVKLEISEHAGQVHWHTSHNVHAPEKRADGVPAENK